MVNEVCAEPAITGKYSVIDDAGIISALAFTPDYSGTYAAGTFSGSVSLYSEDMGGTASGHLEGVSPGGVTQVRGASNTSVHI
jgi:hypothetical protein